MNYAQPNSNEEPEVVVIAQKKVVINTNQEPNNPKPKKQASNIHQKMTTQSTDVFKMILTTNGVVDLGD